MIVIGGVALLLAAGAIHAATRRLTRPLADLTNAAEAIAGGNYASRVDIARRDEIGRLGTAFNAMGAQIEQGHYRLQAEVRERTQTLEALQTSQARHLESEQAYRSTFDEAPIGIAHMALDGRWLRVNARLCDLLGYSGREFIATGLDALAHPEEIGADANARIDLLKGTHERHSAVRRYRRKDGAFISANLTLSLLRDAKGEPSYFIAIIEDISERRLLEEQLRQSQKMEAIGRLAGGIAHDFNNLLTAILGYSALLAEQLDARHPAQESVDAIQKAGDSASSLTRQLLAFSRQQVLQPQVIDLNSVVRDMDALLQRVIGEDVVLTSKLTTPLEPVSADPGQIEQIVLNLAVNARDAMPHGGQLTIETANVMLDETYAATHRGATVGPHVMLAVSDNGIGMSAETVSHMFEPFFTTKPRGKGTGLGLATTYGIVKQSGGSIWVYSELGQGTTFKVYLPRASHAEAALPSAPAVAKGTRGSETILVAEDQDEVRTLTRTILSMHGYTVLEATTGEEALAIVREHREPIHLLFTDVIMPGMSGRELVAEVHQKYGRMRVLFASGYTDDAIVRHGKLDQGVAFLQKPFTPASLLAKVREVLDSPLPASGA
jgi:PAS domain S-box-containing protein